MKNLKKVLALVLAFACAFTMFAGAASFTDEADIQAVDAVNMLTALGVIEGYEDGSFQPDGVVTRAEMAKMIFVVRNNTIDDSAYTNYSTTFTDITNHWARGYIKFCQTQGIIAGKSATEFDPDAPVTGVEAAKMLLVLAGYEPTRAGLTGATWAQNTLRYAGSAGILDDVNSGLESGLPRQYAAQMIYNTLEAYRVQWSTDADNFDYFLNGGARETVGKAYMGLVSDVGSLVSIDKESMTIVLNNSYDSDNYHKYDDIRNHTVGFTKVGTDYSDLLGQTVKVMFKDGRTNNVLGVFAIADNTAVTINKSAVDTDARKLDLNGATYSLDSNVTIYSIADDVTYTSTSSASTFKEAAGAKTANVMTFIDSDGNGNIDFAVERVINVVKVTSVSSSSIVAGGRTYRFDDHNIADGVAKDDWVAISKNMYDDCMDIVVADKVSGTIDSTKPSSAPFTDVCIDGVWYGTPSGLDASDIKAGNTVDAYVYNGVLFSAEKTSGTSGYPDVAMVIAKGTGINRDEAKLLFIDGTTKTVTIDQDDSDAYFVDKLYEYTVSGDEYTLKDLTDATEYGDHTAHTSAANVTKSGNEMSVAGKRVADSAKIFLFDDGDDRGKLITGKQFGTMLTSELSNNGTNDAITYFTAKVDGMTRVSIAIVSVDSAQWSNATSDFETNDSYGYITSDASQAANGYVIFNMWNGSEYVEGVRVKASNANQYKKGTVLGYSSMNEDKELEDATVIDVTMGAMTSATGSGSTVVLGNNDGTALGEYDVDADTVVLFVNSAADSAEVGVEGTISDLREYAADDTNGIYFTNAIWNKSATQGGSVAILVVDTAGKFDTDVINDMNVGTGSKTTTTITFPAGLSVETREGDPIGSGAVVMIGDTLQVENTTGAPVTLTSNLKLASGNGTTIANGDSATVVVSGSAPSIS